MRPSQHYDPQDDLRQQNHRRIFKTLWTYIWPKEGAGYKTRVLASLACLLFAKLLSVVLPIIYKHLVDTMDSQPSEALALPIALIIAFGAARIGQSLFGELRDLIFMKVSQFVRRQVALKTFKHLHSLSLRFHLNRQTGGISRVIERGTRSIRFVLSFMLFNIGPTLIELGLVIGILSYYFDASFALVMVASVAAYIILTVKVTEWRLKYRREMNKMDTAANTKAIDSLLNFETVKYFGNEEFEFQRFDKSLKGFEKASLDSQGSLLLLNVGQQTVIGLGTITILSLAAHGVVKGEMTLGDFVMVNTYMLQLFLPLNFLGFVYREIKQSLIDMDKMFELLEVEPDIKNKEDAPPLRLEKGAISFNNVCFAYNPDRPIIQNLSFTIDPGKTLAIVGSSGAGKSTISRLLLRFYDVTSGSITIDNQDIRDVDQQSLRSFMGVVPQDTVLFNDTVKYNIAYGDPTKPQETAFEAAKMAQIHHFITSLKDGYNTTVGERGLKLSGGEKQRVAIARAILKNPRILIFDEATSSLDTKTERDIQDSLEKITEGRTTLIIAHRLSTIIHAHEIIVLSKGQVHERGTHQELITLNGEYKAMWDRQQQAQEYQRKLGDILENNQHST